ncbi:unnamed protein product [Rotaria sp. Silwood2]|nr:unnamed protein product [Rotaria sp. Silwood2]
MILHSINGIPLDTSQARSPRALFTEEKDDSVNSYKDEVLLLNVGGELLMYATRDTLTYIPNTVLASIAISNPINCSKLIQRDENGRIFLDVSPNLFKHALEQLRQWKNQANSSADQEILSPLSHVKTEFNEMFSSFGLDNYRQTGTAIVRQPPTIGCGGQEAGWLLGTFSKEPWTTTLSSLWYTDEMCIPCRASTPIRTTHCGEFLVFELRPPPFYPARVCTEDYDLN